MSKSLNEKRCLVIGGSTGIGREVVRLLAAEGARLVIAAREEAPLAEAAALAEGEGGEVSTVSVDVTDRAGLDALFEETDQRLGGLDILVVCAALGVGPLADTPEDEWRYVVDTNLVGCLAACDRAVARMRGKGGQILIVGSVSVALKAVGESVYAATKGGLQAFADTLRKEMAEDGVRITLIEPGAVATDMQEYPEDEKRRMVDDGEMLEAVEIAEGVVFALTRSERCNVMRLRMEPIRQKFA